MLKIRSGFTIVELLIVIVVIGILAAITIVAYNGIQQRAYITTLKSDLTNASRQIELVNADAGSYPTSFPNGVKTSKNVALSLSQSTTGYCINAESTTNNLLKWRYDSASGGLQEGLCSGTVISGSESGIKPNLITDTNFALLGVNDGQWRIFRNTSTTAGVTRAGVSTDPYPSRRVLQLNNTANASTTWNAIGGPYSGTGIVAGRTYLTSYYVRLASGSVGNNVISHFGVQDAGAGNTSISVSPSSIAPSAQWQQISRTVVASQNSLSANIIYLNLQGQAVRDNNFMLEFQGFELREQ